MRFFIRRDGGPGLGLWAVVLVAGMAANVAKAARNADVRWLVLGEWLMTFLMAALLVVLFVRLTNTKEG